jgi:hypothetical protein
LPPIDAQWWNDLARVKTFGLFLFFLAAAFAVAGIAAAIKGAGGRICFLFAFLSIFAYKWGRNCYYDLRHDERDDSLPWWNRYF